MIGVTESARSGVGYVRRKANDVGATGGRPYNLQAVKLRRVFTHEFRFERVG